MPSKGTLNWSDKRYHTFSSPSSDFRRKLIDGGGIVINSSGSSDDRSRDGIDDRSHQLLSKPKLSSSSGIASGSSGNSNSDKKHKSKSSLDELKPSSTFANLFGTPITKLSSKQSPEQLAKQNSSNSTKSSLTSTMANPPSQTTNASKSSQKSSSSSTALPPDKSSSKDKSDKSSKDKKDRSKYNSPMKDSGSSSKESGIKKDNDRRDERREEKRKDKNHKERERSKEKSSKRPPSPKPSRSPRRSVSPQLPPPRTNSSNRHDQKHDDKSSTANSNGSNSKKSKKEKKSDKERDRSDKSDVKKEKDAKHQSLLPPTTTALSTSSSSLPISNSQKQRDEKLTIKSEKLNGAIKKEKELSSGGSTPKETKSGGKYRPSFDTKVDSPIDISKPLSASTNSDAKKSSEKVDKDAGDRKHKHKKKDKNKDKDKDRGNSKDRKKDKEKSKAAVKELIEDAPTNHKQRNVQTPPISASTIAPTSSSGTKANATSLTTAAMRKLSEDTSSDFDSDYTPSGAVSPQPPPTTAQPTQRSHSSNANESVEHDTKSSVHLSTDTPLTKATKRQKDNNKIDANKDEKKRKRKNAKNDKQKGDSDSNSGSISLKRKIQSPIDEPQAKKYSKDELSATKNSGLRPSQTSPTTYDHHQQHSIQTNAHNTQSDSITSTSSISLPNISNDSQSFRSPGDSGTDYLTQLRALQQKIMSLQDNNELQQVVDMIAATGCYEITSRTFDFDLCALDRNTVQRLQDFFSHSQSAVL